MGSKRRQPDGSQKVLADIDGYEEPEFVIEHAVGSLGEPLHAFFERGFAARPGLKKRWGDVRAKRSKKQTGKLASATRTFSSDSRALLKDIPELREDFLALIEVESPARAEDLYRELTSKGAGLDLIKICDEASHGTPISCTDAARVVSTLATLAEAIGAPSVAVHLRGPARVLKQRSEWVPRHGGALDASVKSSVTCVGVHWVQPRRVVPGSWWVVTHKSGLEVEVRADQTSPDVVSYLMNELSGPVLAGLAFCFSTTQEFLRTQGLGSPQELWGWIGDELAGTHDLAQIDMDPPYPFRYVEHEEQPRLRHPEHDAEHFRKTESEIFQQLGVKPASVFDIGGEGSVGALAVKGMPMLADLDQAGASIWPFADSAPDAEGVTVVEIFPRSIWTSVFPSECPKSKKNRMRRLNFIADIEQEKVRLSQQRASEVANDERAFDALLTAWALRRYGAALGDTPLNSAAASEGQIWVPPRRPKTTPPAG